MVEAKKAAKDMTPKELGESFVAMIKHGERKLDDRIRIRDKLLECIQHPIVYAVIRDANYVT